MELYCITGIDGAGKSTLAKNLVSVLGEEGVEGGYIYGRTNPVLSRFLMYAGRLFFLKNQDPWHGFSQYTTNKRNVMKIPILRFFYQASIWLDYYPQIWFKILPYFWGKRIVILDRYVYDTVISDLSVHLGYNIKETMRIIENCMRFFPRPRLTFIIDLPEEIAFSRKTDVPDVGYLRERRPYYQALISRPEVLIVDGTVPAATLLANIKGQLSFLLEN